MYLPFNRTCEPGNSSANFKLLCGILCATTFPSANSIPAKHLHLSHLSILSKLSFQFSLCVRFECDPNTFVKIVCLQQHPPYDTKSHQFETLLSYTLLLLFYFHLPTTHPSFFDFSRTKCFPKKPPNVYSLLFLIQLCYQSERASPLTKWLKLNQNKF